MYPLLSPAELFQAAVRAVETRNWLSAETLCRQVLLAEPRNTHALSLLGIVLVETNRAEDAVARLSEAVAIEPYDAALRMNLGAIYRKAGRFADAVECQRQAIALRESYPEAHYNLSLAYRGKGQFEDAIAAVRRATELRPDFAKAHFYLGSLLREQGHLHEAVSAYQTALRLQPDWSEAHYQIANAWYQLLQPAKAVEHLREVLRLEPARSEAALALGHALNTLGRIAEAKAAYERAEIGMEGGARCRDPLSVLISESMAEVIPPDTASIAGYVARVKSAVEAFAAKPDKLNFSNLHTRAPMPSAMLAYHGGNVRPIMEQYAQAISPHVPRRPLTPRQGKPRLGIVITHGHERVFARCWGGITERLSRNLLDVRLVCHRPGANVLGTMLKVADDEYLRLPEAVDGAARLLHEHQFDWLHYWEIGNSWPNYYLPFFRTAPGQSGCWGWPVTSGNPHVDAYLSCEQLEPPDGATHYTEQLVLLKHLPTYFVRPPAPGGPLSVSRFGLKDNQRVYLCTQNLRKYHPDFDPLLADFLRADRQGLLMIVGDRHVSITELLLNRFRRTIPDVLDRVRVMPWMDQEEYLALVAVSDVVLDTLHYGGGANTVYDAVAVGTPIVTLPGEFHRSQWAAAVNRRLGLPPLIAATPEEYVAKAVEVASNPDLRHDLRQQILAAGAELFEDMAVVREHEEYFSQAIAATREQGLGDGE